jgi:hypothetical protein
MGPRWVNGNLSSWKEQWLEDRRNERVMNTLYVLDESSRQQCRILGHHNTIQPMQSNKIQRQFWCNESVHLCASGWTARSHNNLTVFVILIQYPLSLTQSWIISTILKFYHRKNGLLQSGAEWGLLCTNDSIQSLQEKKTLVQTTTCTSNEKHFVIVKNLTFDLLMLVIKVHLGGRENLWYWCLSFQTYLPTYPTPPLSLSHTRTHTHTQWFNVCVHLQCIYCAHRISILNTSHIHF